MPRAASVFGFSASVLCLVAGVWATQDKSGTVKAAKIEKIDYNRDIRPILSNKCFNCHGQDPKSVAADLVLNRRETATADLGGGVHAIVPGKPEESEMMKRITAPEGERMPPASTKKTLTQEEIAILERWIKEGAEYKEHWAFVPPVRVAPPAVQNKAWPKNEIDRFILAKQEESGLKPSAEAPKATLLRRASLDITGLPPTPEEIAAFEADKSKNAYEKQLDRLLASPRYGERMAMDWLDAARYADSNGYQADFERYQWRWRDWVIDAFNKNKPFDKFTVEQLAGDMLPNATLDQKIATGFNRNHRINTEGGVIAEEWRVETVIDRVETTSTVWLGLTSGCARCHDHKYDPISMKSFYGMYAYFNNVPESGTGVESPVNHPPFIPAPTPEQQKEIAAKVASIRELEAKLSTRLAKNVAGPKTWVLDTSRPKSLSDQIVARYELGGTPKAIEGSAPQPAVVGEGKHGDSRSSGSIRTDDKNYVELNGVENFDGTKPFSVAAWIRPERDNGVPIGRMEMAPRYRGWNLYVREQTIMIQIISDWAIQNAIEVRTKSKVPIGDWSHVAMSYDGSGKGEGVRVYINGVKADVDITVNNLKGTTSTEAPVTTKIGRRTQGEFYFGLVDDLNLYSRAIQPEEAAWLAGQNAAKTLLGIPEKSRTADQQKELVRLWSLEKDPEFATLTKQLEATKTEKTKIESQVTSVMVMEEMPKPREAHILERGQYDKLGEKVEPAIPDVFGEKPKNRLELAEWIASAQNPLTARVAVNRLWERLFGMGIVETSEDFGTRASFPSHPELLDWLATEYVRLGWDTKAMMKEIMMSATYRQSSAWREDITAVDPTNRLLARGPRFRMTAEEIRDQAIYVAGLLVEQQGGPSVYPYQPDGVWDDLNVYGNLRNYKHALGPGLYRRSLYTIWKRTAAPPAMTLFDAPSREICRVRRARTNTPLQALALLNDETYVEAARRLAEREMLANTTDEARIQGIFRRVLGRKPDADESRILAASLLTFRERFAKEPESVEPLLEMGVMPYSKKVDKKDLAAYTTLASTILNLDEAITKE